MGWQQHRGFVQRWLQHRVLLVEGVRAALTSLQPTAWELVLPCMHQSPERSGQTSGAGDSPPWARDQTAVNPAVVGEGWVACAGSCGQCSRVAGGLTSGAKAPGSKAPSHLSSTAESPSLAESINTYFELGDQSVICDEPCTKRASPEMCSEGTMSL